MLENFFGSKEKEFPGSSLNTLKSEHLKEGVRPIIAAVGTFGDFRDDNGDILNKIYNQSDNMKNTEDVDYYAKLKDSQNKNFKHPFDNSYVISSINEKDKVSWAYKNCTGVVVSGIDKQTLKNVSFLSHQDPDFFLVSESYANNTQMFLKDIQENIIEMKKNCLPGTIDAAIFGGNYFIDDDERKKAYLKSIETLSSGISELLGFTPPVIVGPKMVHGGSDNVYFDNVNRRLYIVRPETGNSTSESYLPKDIKKQEKMWQKRDFE